MNDVKTIVCAVDGSEHSDKAVELAADLAARYEATLHVLHVFMRGIGLAELERFADHAHLKDIIEQEEERIDEFLQMAGGALDGIYVPPPLPETIRRVAEVVLEDARLVAATRTGRDVVTVALDGSPATRILEYADKVNADMIVLGSRGLGGLRSVLLGSTSHEVSHLASCTCVTVK